MGPLAGLLFGTSLAIAGACKDGAIEGFKLRKFVKSPMSGAIAMLAAIGWSFVAVLALYAAHQAARALALTACVPGGGTIRYVDALWVRLSGEAVQYLTPS